MNQILKTICLMMGMITTAVILIPTIIIGIIHLKENQKRGIQTEYE
jgi:hypothetical protein